MGQPGQQLLLDCHRKSMENWVGTKYIICRSSYKAPTLYRNMQKLSLAWHSPHMLPNKIQGQTFCIVT